MTEPEVAVLEPPAPELVEPLVAEPEVAMVEPPAPVFEEPVVTEPEVAVLEPPAPVFVEPVVTEPEVAMVEPPAPELLEVEEPLVAAVADASAPEVAAAPPEPVAAPLVVFQAPISDAALADSLRSFFGSWARAIRERDFALHQSLGLVESSREFRDLYDRGGDVEVSFEVLEHKRWAGKFPQPAHREEHFLQDWGRRKSHPR